MGVSINNKILSSEAGYQNISNIEGDSLTGTVAQNKAQFDAYPELIKNHFNNLVDDIISDISSLNTGKEDKASGKGLSTNDYTNADKTKLAGIANGAEVNVQVDWNETNTSSDAYIKNKPTIAATISAGTGLTKNGNTINHSNSISQGTIGSSSASSGSTIAIPYATYDAQGHITGKGTHTHTVTASNFGITTGKTNGWEWIQVGDYVVCWTRQQGKVFTNGVTYVSYPFRLVNDNDYDDSHNKPVLLGTFSYDPNSILSLGVSMTVQPSASSANIYLRDNSGAVSGTYNIDMILFGKKA